MLRRKCELCAGAVALACILGGAGTASAHFVLMEPACYSEQDALGSPLKSAPCGQADPRNAVVPTGAVTSLVEGGVLHLTIDETIHHPGHYRVAIAPDMASLPEDPPVMAGSTPCGSAPIDPAPALPVLADGVFVHTARFDGPQSIDIPLPPGFTCDHCVVQVAEFMSNHGLNNPGGCFYHHCADVTITAAAADAGVADAGGPGPDAGVLDGGTDAGDASATDATTHADSGAGAGAETSGCGCRVTRGATRTGATGVGLAALGLLLMRRRRAR